MSPQESSRQNKGFPFVGGKPHATIYRVFSQNTTAYCSDRVDRAGGSRTRTDITVQRILSPQRLPFRHRPKKIDKRLIVSSPKLSASSSPETADLEATAGFEPAIGVLQTPALATWLRRQEKTTSASGRRSLGLCYYSIMSSWCCQISNSRDCVMGRSPSIILLCTKGSPQSQGDLLAEPVDHLMGFIKSISLRGWTKCAKMRASKTPGPRRLENRPFGFR